MNIEKYLKEHPREIYVGETYEGCCGGRDGTGYETFIYEKNGKIFQKQISETSENEKLFNEIALITPIPENHRKFQEYHLILEDSN